MDYPWGQAPPPGWPQPPPPGWNQQRPPGPPQQSAWNPGAVSFNPMPPVDMWRQLEEMARASQPAAQPGAPFSSLNSATGWNFSQPLPFAQQPQQLQQRRFSSAVSQPNSALGASPSGPAPPRKSKASERDAIVPPSKASGGVPEPSRSYLDRAAFPPRALAGPKPMLVVIDLNGTVLFRPSRKQPSRFVARPHAAEFLHYVVRTFYVVVWSSARPENVAALCAKLVSPEDMPHVVAVWGRDRFGLTPADYGARVQCYKRLTRLWADPAVRAAHPDYSGSGGGGGGGGWDQGNTVLIDDSAEKARSEPHNAIQIPEFLGDMHEQPAVLPQVHDYLNTLAVQTDISSYMRVAPFQLEQSQGV